MKLRNMSAILKKGEVEKASPVYLENAQNAIWLFNLQNNYLDF